VLKGQLDPSARVIWAFEKLGWAYGIRWPDAGRLEAKRPVTASRKLGSMTRNRFTPIASRPAQMSDEMAGPAQ